MVGLKDGKKIRCRKEICQNVIHALDYFETRTNATGNNFLPLIEFVMMMTSSLRSKISYLLASKNKVLEGLIYFIMAVSV